MKQLWNKMREMVNKKQSVRLLAMLALIMLLGTSVKSSLAYFTTYATAKGGIPIVLGTKTRIREEFKNWKKLIQIENTGEQNCYVRVKVIAANQFTIEATGTHWTQEADGYWYYSEVLPSGMQTEDILTASITVPKEVQSSFNVVVVQECTPAICDASGKLTGAVQADWSNPKQIVEEEETK